MQPINYLLENKNPLDMLMGGVQQWQNMKNNDYALARTADENRLLQAQHDNEIQGLEARRALDFSKPENLHQYAAMYPEQAKGVNAYIANLEDKKKQALTFDTSKTINLIKNGRADDAIKDLTTKADLLEKEGDTEEASHYRNYANMINQSQNGALGFFQMAYSQLIGKEGAAAYKDYTEANAPKVKDINSGGETGVYITDPVTGKTVYQTLVTNSESPDKQLEATTSITNNVADNEGRATVARINAQGQLEVANANGQWEVKKADVNGQYTLRQEGIKQEGENNRTQAQIQLEAMKLEHKRQQDAIALQQGEYKTWNGKVYYLPKTGGVYEAIGPDGKPILDNSATANGKNSPQQDAKRVAELGGLITEAKSLLREDGVTGSGLGSLADKGAGFFGVSTKGSQLTARLKTVAGQLTSKMPRMEGPQSDSDRKMYEQMAGDVANDSLPVANRLAALETMERLNNKYAQLNGIGQGGQSSAPTKGYNASQVPISDIIE